MNMEEINETNAAAEIAGESSPEAAATAPLTTSVPDAPEVTGDAVQSRGNRAEKVGVVTSDKMPKTVTVRVDRLVKHPIYKRYVKRRSKFMAHNDVEGVSMGDMVRIVETRPLSSKKRWRVVEVLRKASK
jgi:small subunit ribosomal protein S17